MTRRPEGMAHVNARILVVDDEEGVRLITARLLQRYGYATAEAASGREALERLTAEPDAFGAVILDLNMPGMDAPDLVQSLRRIQPALRVIVTSGYEEQDAATRLGPESMTAFLKKPFSTDTLLQTVQRALTGP